ncbi:MAG: hypothetical protein GXW90_10675 [Tepidanaerobacter acetatoxydans]|uniref:CRISPR type III-B/RAMP module-associated protein Cmr5 n=1 Tax=Tepidanaerobacter acetatoxydans (strain DSM 21804 / JCM 16047 / Re1) TaxID=1209989 RepID=F4LX45_TEPAE|nr:hypothetical protein [Tepidanaerobacter acetatoxydans]AEE91023.1 hypothetical protein TepRe1_0844 [Tepidanaerobacter acetatoxydans Re1]NLU11374.1 hypothetical protein [Tepidanaerobacter acetatoxydans]CCP25631.1 conserved protein of unknown function [Tepidanaerobacter acetatoxydans Re1]
MNNSAQILNLDRLAARKGQAVVQRLVDNKKINPNSVDNTVTKALGVLQEDGVYACFLYLLAKEKENGNIVVEEMLDLLKNLGFEWNGRDVKKLDDVLNFINDEVTAKLEPLLLAKDTLEKMLIYARYGAKARA